jgi:hypothetical protein
MKVLMVLVFVLTWVGNAVAWEVVTPLGIRVKASQSTMSQYNRHWQTYEGLMFPNRPHAGQDSSDIGPKWDTIDWSVIDQFYLSLYTQHGSPNKADPTKLIISIRPVAYQCWGNDCAGYDFTSSYGCLDGLYASSNRIAIHLGDDPGQSWGSYRPFCGTALEHELNHYFLFWKDDPQWSSEGPGFIADYKGVGGLCQ